MAEVTSKGDQKPSRSRRRKKRSKKGSYTADELIKLWGAKKSQVDSLWRHKDEKLLKNVQSCPNLDTIVLKTHEVHEDGDQTKVKIIFPIKKDPLELPPEVSFGIFWRFFLKNGNKEPQSGFHTRLQ